MFDDLGGGGGYIWQPRDDAQQHYIDLLLRGELRALGVGIGGQWDKMSQDEQEGVVFLAFHQAETATDGGNFGAAFGVARFCHEEFGGLAPLRRRDLVKVWVANQFAHVLIALLEDELLIPYEQRISLKEYLLLGSYMSRRCADPSAGSLSHFMRNEAPRRYPHYDLLYRTVGSHGVLGRQLKAIYALQLKRERYLRDSLEARGVVWPNAARRPSACTRRAVWLQ